MHTGLYHNAAGYGCGLIMLPVHRKGGRDGRKRGAPEIRRVMMIRRSTKVKFMSELERHIFALLKLNQKQCDLIYDIRKQLKVHKATFVIDEIHDMSLNSSENSI